MRCQSSLLEAAGRRALAGLPNVGHDRTVTLGPCDHNPNLTAGLCDHYPNLTAWPARPVPNQYPRYGTITLFASLVIASYNEHRSDIKSTMYCPWILHELRLYRYNPTSVVYVGHHNQVTAFDNAGESFGRSPIEKFHCHKFGEFVG
jgi:hypothetical protein